MKIVMETKRKTSKAAGSKTKGKTVRFNGNVNKFKYTACERSLRKRKIQNYAELAGLSPKDKTEPATKKIEAHIPIYLKQDVFTKPNKQLKDPFEFVPETHRTCRKLKVSESVEESNRDSILYDKDTHEVLKKLVAKEEAQLKVKERRLKKKIRLKQADKINVCENPRDVKERSVTLQNIKCLPNNSSDGIECCFGFDTDLDEDEPTVIPASPFAMMHTNKNLKTIRTTKKVDKENDLAITSTPLIRSKKSVRNKNSCRINIISNIAIAPTTSGNLRKSVQDTPAQAAVTQKASANSIIRKSHAIPLMRHTSSTAATSTPKYQNQPPFVDFQQNQSSPWRSDSVNVTRNPHILSLKNTWLPSYNQQMVLDSKLISNRSVSNSENKNTSMVQTSMTSFVDGCKTPSRTIIEQSLFDNSDFSPIKTHKKNTPKSKSPKRDVFGILKPSNKQNLPQPEKNDNINNCFGFDSFDDENEGNKENRRTRSVTQKKKNVQIAQPTRILPKETKKLQQDAMAEFLQNIYVDAREEKFPEPLEGDAPQVALFEDLEVQKPTRRSYERKRPRRVRIKSVDSDQSEESIKPKTKRKDIRTPQEEEEFNKWVTQFNAMCEEVDNHTLETE